MPLRNCLPLLAFLLAASGCQKTVPHLVPLKFASPFTDHMVIQRELPVPIWGTGDVGAKVTVSFGSQSKTTTADVVGKWQVELSAMPAASEARTLKVATNSGGESLEIHDVLVGEVWLCSGQSNMDFTVAKTPKYYFAGVNNEAEEVAAANYPHIRMFTGAPIRSSDPKQEVPGTWKVCTPEYVREFSAVGYFFARDLQKELKVPVGLLTLTFGASTAQAWVRRDAIVGNAKLVPVLNEFDAKVKGYAPPTDEQVKQWEEADAQAKAAGKRGPKKPWSDPVQDQHNPTVLFNGMIAPVIPYAVRGVLWYQGESITAPKELFPLWNETLIKDWRVLWKRELPFYFVQLAALNNNSNSPAVREMQAEALKLPSTAMAVTIDIGDAKNVHPKNKQDVGARLARIALAKSYGRDLEYSGPTYKSMAVGDGAVRLQFDHVGGGLIARDGALKTFEVAGADGKFFPAEASIEGDTIVVRCPEVAAPERARYAWSNYPEGCNLFNKDGLPAPPFRTDTKQP